MHDYIITCLHLNDNRRLLDLWSFLVWWVRSRLFCRFYDIVLCPISVLFIKLCSFQKENPCRAATHDPAPQFIRSWHISSFTHLTQRENKGFSSPSHAQSSLTPLYSLAGLDPLSLSDLLSIKMEVLLSSFTNLLDLVTEVTSAKVIQACQTNLSHSCQPAPHSFHSKN